MSQRFGIALAESPKRGESERELRNKRANSSWRPQPRTPPQSLKVSLPMPCKLRQRESRIVPSDRQAALRSRSAQRTAVKLRPQQEREEPRLARPSPWYSTTGDRKESSGRKPTASTACWAADGLVRSLLCACGLDDLVKEDAGFGVCWRRKKYLVTGIDGIATKDDWMAFMQLESVRRGVRCQWLEARRHVEQRLQERRPVGMARRSEFEVQRDEGLDQDAPLRRRAVKEKRVATAIRPKQEVVRQVLLNCIGSVGRRDLFERKEPKVLRPDEAFSRTKDCDQIEIFERQFTINARPYRKARRCRAPPRRDRSNMLEKPFVHWSVQRTRLKQRGSSAARSASASSRCWAALAVQRSFLVCEANGLLQ